MSASTDSAVNRRATNGLDYAPHANFHLLSAAYQAATRIATGVGLHVGGVSSMDQFYDNTDSLEKFASIQRPRTRDGSERALHPCGEVQRQALAVLTVSDHVITHEAMDAMLGNEALKRWSKWDSKL